MKKSSLSIWWIVENDVILRGQLLSLHRCNGYAIIFDFSDIEHTDVQLPLKEKKFLQSIEHSSSKNSE